MRRLMPVIVFGCLLTFGFYGCGDDGEPEFEPSIVVFNGEANRLNAYDVTDDFRKQTVIPSHRDVPVAGRDINGQICFRRDGDELHMISGEDTNQGPSQLTAGWGFFRITGKRIGEFGYEQLGKLIPTYQPGGDGGENYGCGFLRDGRLVTTDVGNQAFGDANGQLIVWFPPFDTGAEYTPTGVVPVNPARYCKLDIGIGTAGGIYVDADDRVYLASARGEPGIYRYTGPFPTSDDAAGGCGRRDGTGAPLADTVRREKFIATDEHVLTPNAVVRGPRGTFFVSSVINGVIAEYDASGVFLRRVLSPGEGEMLPFSTGTPLGIGLDSEGTLYYADIGIEIRPGSIGPGPNAGSVRRIRFVGGQPQAPEALESGLNFPDGIGVLENH